MCRKLESQRRIGSKKRDDRIAQHRKTGIKKAKYIHMDTTLGSCYIKYAKGFGNYLISRGYGHVDLDTAKTMVPDFLNHYPSISTRHTARSALNRVFDCNGSDLCSLPPRRAKDITRGRTLTKRALAIRKNHPRTVEILRSVGVRNDKEMWQMKPKNFRHDDNGRLILHVVGKGGLHRDILVIGPGATFIEEDLASGQFAEDKSMYTIPSHANVHALRADYAARCYLYAVESGLHSDKKPYHGYDRACLDFVSRNLGHGPGRYYTVYYNYLSYGVAYH